MCIYVVILLHKSLISLSLSLIPAMANTSTLITIFFLFFIPSATMSLSFNLSSIGPSDSSFIKVTEDAYITAQGIQVTPNERDAQRNNKIGRATYTQPLHLWDKASLKLSDFSTHFSFIIDSNGSDYHGDGLAFFLAPLNSIVEPWMGGGSLGLGGFTHVTSSSSQYSFVAVEFDTFFNGASESDSNLPTPNVPHVGIDINTMTSVKTAIWDNSISEGVQSDAWISYNSSSMILSVDFTINRTKHGNLSHAVDLRDYLPEFVLFGFSAATGDMFEKHNVKSWDFSSTDPITVSIGAPEPSLSKNLEPSAPSSERAIGGNNGGNNSKDNNNGGNNSKDNNKGLILGLSTGGLSILILAAFASYGLCKKSKNKKNESGNGEDSFDSLSISNELEEGTGPKKFPYGELVLATSNFAEDKKLGEGGFGGVYRGLLSETNSEIAVKRVSKGSKQGAKEYASEVKVISQLRHRNLVQLLGWCHERGELLLVYEFMTNGSLDSHLFKGQSLLTWGIRYKIVQGLASALFYLHEGWERCVVHRDIKASNVMLDSNFNAKLGDFGLARLVDHEKGSQTTLMAGTMGYLAPECALTGRASKESDVYSFGILLLEIACGRRAIAVREREARLLVEWVWALYGAGQLLDAADPKLEMKYEAREVEQVMVVGLWCVHPDSGRRPSVRQVIQVVNSEAQMPTLPSTIPVATYQYSP